MTANSPEMPSSSARPDILICLALFASVAAIYAPWLGNEFVYDDAAEIVEWPLMHSPRNIPQFFTTSDVGLYRPLKYTIISLLWAQGGGRPPAFHLAAMLAHAAAAILLFLIFTRLDFSRAAAAVGAFLFAVHPVQAESVYWISALSVPLSSMLLFGAFWAAMTAASPCAPWRAAAAMAAAVLLLIAALLIREAAIVFPALLLLYAIAPPRSISSPAGRRRLVWLILMCAAVVMAFWIGRGAVMRHRPHEFDYFAGSLGGALLTAPHLIMRYMILFAVPSGLTVYHWPRVADSLLSPVFLLPAATLAAMAWLTWRRRRDMPRGLFFFGCLIVPLIPVLNIVPINSVFAERYMHLPMFGLCGLAAWGFDRGLDWARSRGYTRTAWLAAAGLLAVLALLSAARGRVWRDDVSLFNDATAKTPPQAIVPRYNLAKALALRGQADDAMDVYREVILIQPDHLPSLVNLSNLLIADGQLDLAERALIHADGVAPANSTVLNGLGTIWFRRGDDALALQYFEAAAQMPPPNPQAHFNAGMVCKRQGRADDARRWFQSALDLNPDYRAAAEALQQ